VSRPLSAEILDLEHRIAAHEAEGSRLQAALAALKEAQRALIDAMNEESHLTRSHSDRTISPMQEHSLGVRIAAGRSGQTESRKAQIRLGLTDGEVAEMLGVKRSTVCKWHLGSTRIPDEARKTLAKRGIPANSWGKKPR